MSSAAGCSVGYEGRIGGEKGCFANFDTEADRGTVIEISGISGGKGRFFQHIRPAATGWNGSEPIREVKAR